jgi:Uma2 family endonuclease
MATVPTSLPGSVLKTGQRMSRAEFHRLYEQTPEDFKAELIGGVVFVASPLRLQHGRDHLDIGAVLVCYQAATPGVEGADNATILLGDDSEPQPDLSLRILPEYGGQSQTSGDDYIVGAPELVIEVAYSSRDFDLHEKRDDCARNGILEYLVACVDEKCLRWFDLPNGRGVSPGPDGVVRIRTFPGLWIDGGALFAGYSARLLATAQAGLATPEHAAFARQLSERRAQLKRP